jgi:hypothetical protein
VGGGGAARWLPKCPPSPKWRVSGSKRQVYSPPPNMGTCQNDPPGTRIDPPPLITWWPATCHVIRGEGRRETRHFSKYSLIKGYFKRPISQESSAKLAPTLLQCQSLSISFLQALRRENVAYIVTLAYIRPLSQSATLHSTGNISAESSEHQEQSRPQQHMWNSKLFVIFPLKSTAAHSLHIQHLLCGLRL